MRLRTIPYSQYEMGLPQQGNYVLGQEIGDNIVVYQAFNHQIADYAIAHQKFGGNRYSFSRMTWIKPNFLWMMYRSGWAEKQNQERILAIHMKKDSFEKLLSDGVYSNFIDTIYGTQEQWKKALAESDVRIQWDPDHDYKGDKLNRRAVQIGIRNQALLEFNAHGIVLIEDITDFVKEQRANLNDTNELQVIYEQIIPLREDIKEKYAIPSHFIPQEIQKIIDTFEKQHSIPDEDFNQLLIGESLRNSFVQYIRNYTHKTFSRYLLEKAIDKRLNEEDILCEDLLLFSFFCSKNGEIEDFDLILNAKKADFDTWCGFDGEMVFYTLGFEATKAQLQAHVKHYSQTTVDYFCDFTEEYLYTDINSRAFWYF